jgi:hypothetical protein
MFRGPATTKKIKTNFLELKKNQGWLKTLWNLVVDLAYLEIIVKILKYSEWGCWTVFFEINNYFDKI